MIFNDIVKALGQLDDPRFRGVNGKGIGLTIGLFVALFAAFLWVLKWLDPATMDLPFLGPNAFTGVLLALGGIILMFLAATFLMIPVASIITSIFLDDVADAVEVRHYPHLPPAPHVTFGDAVRDTLNFLGVLVSVNLVALLLLPFYWFAAPVVFYLINGWLLGREYFTVAAIRREGRKGANALREKHRGEIWFAGIVLAIPLTIPLLNLLVPILGVAAFTHFYHRIAQTR